MTRAAELSITTTVLGVTANPVRRTGAVTDDVIMVTGRLGGPARALAAFLKGETPDATHRARFAEPAARIQEGRWLREHGAHAIIDISDGLAADAMHLAIASEVSLCLDESRIPCVPGASAREAISSGEEYELLVAMPSDADVDHESFAEQFGIPLTTIGVAEPRSGADHVRWTGGLIDSRKGHDHFA